MIDKGKVSVLGVQVDAVDYEAAVARIIAAASDGRPYAVSALAVHGVMTGVDDGEHLARLNQFDLITPDGQPVRWAMNWLHGTELTDRVYGPKLTLEVCRAAAEHGLPVYFYGSTQETLDHLAEQLPTLAPGITIAGMRPSKFATSTEDELDVITDEIKATGAKICMVGLGCPRQEVFAFENAKRLSMPTLAVGAAFDFHAGLAKEPPAWVQRAGLQWAQRLLANPKRLWRRYLILNPRYSVAVLRQKLGRYTPTDESRPSHIGYS
ncbi:WecB/TagA/CpsF family glycosyltransferase [Ilumatobacter coccineus]|uniref:Putative glycosyltransferase n=1 Tax=Ilumatobacter coccineus (strain NBRC 103263 / KCTC 29153 / YM16-304) TaxID=1313172 RepID=A0A6C7E7S3_ILUCY|nr:WecB/TagA/CpsF family glycosyltransferase [Ilumatobacter coccineus]BAN02531.1 putative glycosyltransferase [Ilumatobacter coccineus YM16-304]